MLHLVDQAVQSLIEFNPKNTEYLLALSGGLDSSVLLYALAKIQKEKSLKLKLVHVNHQLQTLADDWVDFCKSQSALLNLECEIENVSINVNSGDSIEASARYARYSVFAAYMHENMCLLTAHHADDQLETFLLQLFRGAGPKGLSSMAWQKEFKQGKHARPLLRLSREQLEEYASQNKLEFIQDPTNDVNQFDRNFLRNEIIPQIKVRYPNVQKSVGRSAEHIATEHFILDELLSDKLQGLLIDNTLDIREWSKLEKNIKILLLRKWISDAKMQLPSTKILDDVLTQLENAHGESKTIISWSNVEIRAYSQKAFLLKKIDEVNYKNSAESILENAKNFQLPEEYGQLSFDSGASDSLKLRLAFRLGGEKLRLPRHMHHINLKQLYQKNRVLPWMRSRIPLLFDGEVLVAIGDLWLNADWLDKQKLPNFSVNWANKPLLFVP